MSSKWEAFELDEKVRSILNNVTPSSPGHHLGMPYLTAYQIAIEFNRRHPEIVGELGYKVGGKAVGEHVSLSQYMARQLSQRIKAGKLTDIEGGFLSRQDLGDMVFSTGIESSADGSWDASIYRIKGSV